MLSRIGPLPPVNALGYAYELWVFILTLKALHQTCLPDGLPAGTVYSMIAAFFSLGKPAVAAALSAFWPWSQLPTQNPSQIGF